MYVFHSGVHTSGSAVINTTTLRLKFVIFCSFLFARIFFLFLSAYVTYKLKNYILFICALFFTTTRHLSVLFLETNLLQCNWWKGRRRAALWLNILSLSLTHFFLSSLSIFFPLVPVLPLHYLLFLHQQIMHRPYGVGIILFTIKKNGQELLLVIILMHAVMDWSVFMLWL